MVGLVAFVVDVFVVGLVVEVEEVFFVLELGFFVVVEVLSITNLPPVSFCLPFRFPLPSYQSILPFFSSALKVLNFGCYPFCR